MLSMSLPIALGCFSRNLTTLYLSRASPDFPNHLGSNPHTLVAVFTVNGCYGIRPVAIATLRSRGDCTTRRRIAPARRNRLFITVVTATDDASSAEQSTQHKGTSPMHSSRPLLIASHHSHSRRCRIAVSTDGIASRSRPTASFIKAYYLSYDVFHRGLHQRCLSAVRLEAGSLPSRLSSTTPQFG